MKTLTENTANVIGYTKCGEILLSKKNLQHNLIFRCIDCEEIYTWLDIFISHLNGKCAVRNKAESNVAGPTEVKVEPMGYEELPVNLSQVANISSKGNNFIKEEICDTDNCEEFQNSDEEIHVSGGKATNAVINCDENSSSTIVVLEIESDSDDTLSRREVSYNKSFEINETLIFNEKTPLARIKSEDISDDEFISLKEEVKLKHEDATNINHNNKEKNLTSESDVSMENLNRDDIEPQTNDNDIEDNSDSSIDIDPEDLYNQLWMKMKNLENNGEEDIQNTDEQKQNIIHNKNSASDDDVVIL